MENSEWTPEDNYLPDFVDAQDVMPLPCFVTREIHRSSKDLIREKIAATTVCDRSRNAMKTVPARNNNG